MKFCFLGILSVLFGLLEIEVNYSFRFSWSFDMPFRIMIVYDISFVLIQQSHFIVLNLDIIFILVSTLTLMFLNVDCASFATFLPY